MSLSRIRQTIVFIATVGSCLVGSMAEDGVNKNNIDISDLGLELIYISPGSFRMGSTDGPKDERPVMQVAISRAYWLGKTEITQEQWSAIMRDAPSRFKGGDLPVEQVSWNDALEFCRRLTEREQAAGRLPQGFVYTLPTEAQWEYACRAGSTGDYAGKLNAMAWYSDNSGGQTHPVGKKRPNPWGLHDMHGNVWEWCLDSYAVYIGGSVTDPIQRIATQKCVRRGGGWGSIPLFCRSAYRSNLGPNDRFAIVGFRVALSPIT